MTKKSISILLSLSMLILPLGGCGKIEKVTDTNSIEVSSERESSEEEVSSTQFNNSNISSMQNIEFDKEDFLKYFEDFIRFFASPIKDTKDAEKYDLLYFTMLQTYSESLDNDTILISELGVEDEVVITSNQEVIIPEKILKNTVERLFGISNYDFNEFHKLKYYQDQMRPLDYYDEKMQSYHMNIGSSFGLLLEFDRDCTKIIFDSHIVTVKTILEYYYDLGKLDKTQKAEYQFTICKDDKGVYYRLNKIVFLE